MKQLINIGWISIFNNLLPQKSCFHCTGYETSEIERGCAFLFLVWIPTFSYGKLLHHCIQSTFWTPTSIFEYTDFFFEILVNILASGKSFIFAILCRVISFSPSLAPESRPTGRTHSPIEYFFFSDLSFIFSVSIFCLFFSSSNSCKWEIETYMSYTHFFNAFTLFPPSTLLAFFFLFLSTLLFLYSNKAL